MMSSTNLILFLIINNIIYELMMTILLFSCRNFHSILECIQITSGNKHIIGIEFHLFVIKYLLEVKIRFKFTLSIRFNITPYYGFLIL
jgi:hypothetical protein